MSEPPKKFTFGFSKVVKKSNLVAPPLNTKAESNNVQLIDCLEANTIKLKNGEENKDEVPLIIPIIGPRKSSTIANGRSIAEIVEDFSDIGTDAPLAQPEVQNDTALPDSLEAMAAREILKEGANATNEGPISTLETLPSADDNKELQRESTLEDYDNIPVNQFGLAMLRGMGWKPDEGIGKNKKLVPVTAPVVRPKGMGLGADKMLLAAVAKKAANSSTKDEEELKMVKGAYVKVAAGMHKDHYAQVEGFSEDTGRVLLKLAIGGRVVSVNEATVVLVSKSDYTKNSKVLNAAKYDEFKMKEETGSNASRNRKSPSPKEKIGHQPSSPSKISKKTGSNIGTSRNFSPKRERSQSPNIRQRKENHKSRSNSVSPERVDRKKSSSRSHNYRYESPDQSQSRRDSSPDSHRVQSSRRRSTSRSCDTNIENRVQRSRSRSHSHSRDKYSHRRKKYDSDSDSQSYSKKKKKCKERRRAHNNSSSEESSPKAKGKKSKRNRSRTPSRKHK